MENVIAIKTASAPRWVSDALKALDSGGDQAQRILAKAPVHMLDKFISDAEESLRPVGLDGVKAGMKAMYSVLKRQNMSAEDGRTMVETWQKVFQGVPQDLWNEAVEAMIVTQDWFPVPREMMDLIKPEWDRRRERLHGLRQLREMA